MQGFPLPPRCSLRFAAHRWRVVATCRLLVAEGMNSRRSRRALVFVHAPHAEHGAAGALSLLSFVVELVTIEPGVRADLATQGGSTFTFDWYALITRTRPLEWPPRPFGAASAGVVRRRVRISLVQPLLRRISHSLPLAGASLPASLHALA